MSDFWPVWVGNFSTAQRFIQYLFDLVKIITSTLHFVVNRFVYCQGGGRVSCCGKSIQYIYSWPAASERTCTWIEAAGMLWLSHWWRDLPDTNFQFGDWAGAWRLNRFTARRTFQNILQSPPFFIVCSCLDLPRENPKINCNRGDFKHFVFNNNNVYSFTLMNGLKRYLSI